ncbi:hypothetical protein CVS53_02704 [Microbacterium oxydans]|nr:hypothetical protein CVS53_02704 [Microbacterium oxydans]
MADLGLTMHSANTHLYPGAHLRTDPVAGDFWASPRDLRLVFADGVDVDAELMQNTRGDLVIAVSSYRTVAGTIVGPKDWRARPDGSGLTVIARV